MVMTARIMLGWVDPEELLDEEAEVSEDDAELGELNEPQRRPHCGKSDRA